MRVALTATVLLGVLVLGFTTVGRAAQGQEIQAGITTGEKLTIAFDASAAGIECTVISVRGDFLGCQADPQSSGRVLRDHWYNLKMLARIDRPVQR